MNTNWNPKLDEAKNLERMYKVQIAALEAQHERELAPFYARLKELYLNWPEKIGAKKGTK